MSSRTGALLLDESLGAIMNLISRNKFPIPTYKLGDKRVIDLAVLRAFFEAGRRSCAPLWPGNVMRSR